MNAKISVFVICVEAIIYICYYIVSMTVSLRNKLIYNEQSTKADFLHMANVNYGTKCLRNKRLRNYSLRIGTENLHELRNSRLQMRRFLLKLLN